MSNTHNNKNTYRIKSLVEHIRKGNEEGWDLIIPEYQRDYVWDEKKIPLLLDSIYNNYPIGAIVTWEDKENNCVHLLDGLQRTFSIVKISNNFSKYVSSNLLYKAISNVIDHESDEFDYFKSYYTDIKLRIKQTSSEIRNIGLEEVRKNLISNTPKIEENESLHKINHLLMRGIKELINFKDKNNEEGFWEYKISRISIDPKLKKKDVTEIFERLNTGAKELNKFEVFSSHWSNYPIELEGNFIRNFIKDRKQKYALALGLLDEGNSSTFKTRKTTPSDYIYATLLTILKDTKYFKDMFLEKQENEIYSLKNIEELTYIFLNYFNLSNNDEDFKSLGRCIKRNFDDDDEESTKFRDLLKKSINLVEDNLTFFNFAKSNSKDYKNVKDNLKISSHILISMINQVMNELKEDKNDKFQLKENQLNYWLLSETIDKVYGGNSGNKGLVATKDKRYVTGMPPNLLSKIISFIENEEDKQLKSVSSATKILLAFVQQGSQIWSSENLQIDHIIPQEKLRNSQIKYKIHTFYNLQLLKESDNRTKNDSIEPNSYQFDVLKDTKYLEDTQLEEYFLLIKACSDNLGLNYEDLYNFRKEKVIPLLKDIFK